MGSAIAMVISEVVGVGIFLAPAEMMRTLGSARLALAVWGVMGALTALGALCYAELATRFPRAGGGYVFLREAFGRRAAFIYGWMSLLVVDPGLTAALGIGFAQYLLAATGGRASLVAPVAVGAIAAFGAVTLIGIGASARAMRWSAVAKLAAVGVLVIASLVRAGGTFSGAAGAGLAAATLTPGTLAASAVAAFFAFGGWWDLGKMSEDLDNPRRTLPAALLGGVGAVAAIYALVTAAFMIGPPIAASSGDAFVASVGAALFGAAAGRLLAVIVVIAVAGSLAAVLLGAPRVYLAMARDRIFPAQLGRMNAGRGTAPGATLVQVSLASLLAMLGTFDQVLGFFVPAAIFFLGLSAAALFVFPRPAAEAPVFRVPLYPGPLVLFLLLIGAILVLFAAGQPRQTLLGAAIVLLGVPVSWYILPTETEGAPHAD